MFCLYGKFRYALGLQVGTEKQFNRHEEFTGGLFFNTLFLMICANVKMDE